MHRREAMVQLKATRRSRVVFQVCRLLEFSPVTETPTDMSVNVDICSRSGQREMPERSDGYFSDKVSRF